MLGDLEWSPRPDLSAFTGTITGHMDDVDPMDEPAVHLVHLAHVVHVVHGVPRIFAARLALVISLCVAPFSFIHAPSGRFLVIRAADEAFLLNKA